ncbi:unnamed protein product [Rotaria sordida]|uniref:Uncharacterized protein n=1 Tax=Rotaria sordida TaxID=392033 RepID=A0A819E1K9_9BILA|nr:unnamed protein product [Rotaria sordida]
MKHVQKKKRLAQEAPDRKMPELNLTKIIQNKSLSESSSTASKTPISHSDLTDETGYLCWICREDLEKNVHIQLYEDQLLNKHDQEINRNQLYYNNANTPSNGLLPLWGPDVAQAQFTTSLSNEDRGGGGGRESNIRLIPYEIHRIVYVLRRIASKAFKSFATYKTTLVFFGLVNAFFFHMLNTDYLMH